MINVYTFIEQQAAILAAADRERKDVGADVATIVLWYARHAKLDYVRLVEEVMRAGQEMIDGNTRHE